MRLTLLGTGDAGGVPRYGCDCIACTRAHQDPNWQRHACCALLDVGAERYLIDAGLSDLSDRFPPGTLGRIFLTHFHVDHVQGLFPMRWGLGPPIEVLCPQDTTGCADLYAHPGIFTFRAVMPFVPLVWPHVQITPVPLQHSKTTLGYCFETSTGKLAYLTDTVGLPPKTRRFLQRWQPDIMVLDCCHPPQPTPPRNHNDVTRALEIIETIHPKQSWLTHISHDCDRWFLEQQPSLSATIYLSRDGETLTLE